MAPTKELEADETGSQVSWVYQLKKPALVSALEEVQLSSEGTVEELRARLVKYYRSREAETAGALPENPVLISEVREETGAVRKTKGTMESKRPLEMPLKSRIPPEPRPGESLTMSAAEICDKVRKWGVKFDGATDPWAFLERVDELMECYGFNGQTLLLALPELLKGRALLWYRNHRQCTSWKKKSAIGTSILGSLLRIT